MFEKNTGKKRSSFSFTAVLLLLFALFGTAYAALIDEVTIPSYQQVNDANSPKLAPDYTKAAADDQYIEREWSADDANLDVVWKTFKQRLSGSSEKVFVVVMEECIDLEHSDLAGSFYPISRDQGTGEAIVGAYLNETVLPNVMSPLKVSEWKTSRFQSGSTYDRFFHGSHVAGIVGARHNSLGIAGCSPEVYIVPVFVGGLYGETEAFDWVLNDLYSKIQSDTGKTPRIIIQRAFGTTGTIELDDPTVTEHFNNYKKASDKGILVVHGAGNVHRDLHDGSWDENGKEVTVLPSCGGIVADNFLSVAAHGPDRKLSPNSNYSTAGAEAQVHLSAPGVSIVSLGRNGEYWVSSGTSMAAPHVSGTAALLWQLFPDATAAEIKTLILEGAKVSNGMAVTPHNGEAATTIGGYVRTGYLDAACSVKKSKEVLGASRGLDIQIPLKKIVITPAAYGVQEGDTIALSATTLLPFTADNKNLNFVSSNPSAAWVTQSGNSYVINTGNVSSRTGVDIYAEAADGQGAKSNTISLTITQAPVAVTSIAIKKDGNTVSDGGTVDVTLGQSVTLEAAVTPEDATIDDSALAWSIEPTAVFSRTGRNITVTPSAAGQYDVTLKTGTLQYSCRLNVTNPSVVEPTGLDVTGGDSVAQGGSLALGVSVSPDGAEYKPADIAWRITSGADLASLSASSGSSVTLTAGSTGTGTVTIQASLGSIVSIHEVKVTGGSSGGGGGGGCNTGFGSLFLLAGLLPVVFGRKK